MNYNYTGTNTFKCGCEGPGTLRTEGYGITPTKRCAAHNSSSITVVYQCGCCAKKATREICFAPSVEYEPLTLCEHHQQELDRSMSIPVTPCKYTPDADGNPVLCGVHRRDESIVAMVAKK